MTLKKSEFGSSRLDGQVVPYREPMKNMRLSGRIGSFPVFQHKMLAIR